MTYERKKDHKRNLDLDQLLVEVNNLLSSAESTVLSSTISNHYPLILIMGAPRSGTTLFMQWLSGSGYFAYPSNMLSRFYGAPYIGAKIQLMLTKHDFNGEIFDFVEEVPFVSRLGKTKGALAPNEFWYFWRRFFHFGEIQKLTSDELDTVDSKTFVAEIAALEDAFGKPFAMKAMIMNWNIPYLAQILDKVLFVHIKRHPIYNAQSLIKARLDYYGDTNAWYSFKPPEYPHLASLEPFEQVAGQVYCTNNAVEEGLAAVPDSKKISVQYENFCADPANVFAVITSKLQQQGVHAAWEYNGPKSFTIGNHIDFSDVDMKQLVEAYQAVSGEVVSL